MSALKISENQFGVLYNSDVVHLYTLSNGNMSVTLSDYGCTIASINIPDQKLHRYVDVVLGPSTLEGLANDNLSFGTVVGRFANRIGGAKFTLNGIEYNLDNNDSGNCLHGGFDRYEKKVWEAKTFTEANGCGVKFSRFSPDGEQGMPGNLMVCVSYTLTDKNELVIDYSASTDKDTPVNLTNHAYFNLKGYAGGTIYDQELQLDCSKFLEVSEKLIPTGKFVDVSQAAAFDFRTPKALGKDIDKTEHGYDHAFAIDGFDGKLKKFAVLKDPASGRTMEVSTTLPACQVYTANWIAGSKGKNGTNNIRHGAVCLETESFPDTPNQSEFPSCIVSPDKPYHEVTVYKFGF